MNKCNNCNTDLGIEDTISALAFPQQGDMYTIEMVPMGYKCPSCNHENRLDAPYYEGYESAFESIGQGFHNILPTSPPLMHTMLL